MNDLSRLNADSTSVPKHEDEVGKPEEPLATPISDVPVQAQPSSSHLASEATDKEHVDSVVDAQTQDAEEMPAILDSAASQNEETTQTQPAESEERYNCARVVGARLAQLREEKNWLLDDVSAQLKVPVSKLRALEAGEVSVLPDAAFTLGLVRAYSKMLGIDPMPFIEELRNANGPLKDALAGLGMHRELLSKNVLTTHYLAKSKEGFLTRFSARRVAALLGLSLACIAVVGLLVYGYHESSLKTVSNEQIVTEEKQAESLPTPAALNTPAAPVASSPASVKPVSSSIASTATAHAASTLPGMSSNTPPPPSVATQPPAPAVAAPKPAAPTPATQAVATTSPAAPSVSPAAASSATHFAVVHFQVSQDNWISVSQADGKLIYAGLLKAGAQRSVQGWAPFKVTAGSKTGLDVVTLDGKPVDLSRYLATKQDVVRFNLS